MPSVRPQSILIVEDDVDTCDNLSDILELDGHHCSRAYSAHAALAHPKLPVTSIILLDWKLPDGTAMEILPKLHLLAPHAEVVIVTGHSELEFAVTALRNGTSDYLVKPIDSGALRASISRLAHRRWLADEKQRSEMMFRQLVESAPCLIVILKGDRTISYFSPFAEQLTGFEAGELEGMPMTSIFIEDHSTEQAQELVEQILTSTSETNPISLKGRDGVRRWIIWKTRELQDDDGLPGILAVGQDVTEHRRAVEKLVQSERLAAIGEAMTGLAHESRNALQRSQAFLELLAGGLADRPDEFKLVGQIQTAQNHLHHLYEEVRQYAAPIQLKLQPVEAWELVSETWSFLEQARVNLNATLINRSDEGAEMRVDRLMLQQVVRNILENSLAASGEKVQIEFQSQAHRDEDGDWLRLSLRDNGPGLNEEQRERIFEPFYTTKMRGTGLGMTLSKRIVEAHGGRMMIGDSPGTEIVILLPVA